MSSHQQYQHHHHHHHNTSYGSAKSRSSAASASEQYHSPLPAAAAAAQPKQYHHPQHQRMNIEVGHFVVDLHGQVADMSGDFTSNKLAVETLLTVVKEMRLHMVMKLTKDQFKVLTVQFPDHYYKVNFWADCADVRKYKMHKADLQSTGSPAVNV